ncbi:MAG: 4Fe-4S dicluster domain-containing protein [Candidatus Krumholzibacteriota bacterium]|nr:4Fe-4S dicluster domain-containing protein [Candidatus Krumholzibacteriota bacterium]
MRFIDSTNFERLLKKLSSEGELFVPVRDEDSGKLHLQRAESFPLPEGTTFDGYRTVESLKAFGQLVRSTVAEYPMPDGEAFESEGQFPTFVVVGAKACDLYALKMVDKVLIEGEFTDPFYQSRRDHMIIISADCSECAESCFCNLLGKRPFPEEGFDLNISRISGGFLVEAGSLRGEEVISANEEFFTEPRPGQAKARDDVRAKVIEELENNNRDFPEATVMTEPLRELLTDDLWSGEAARCVECGACTNICPTCYCFLLFDQREGNESYRRISSWDSCQVTGYARMAGMGTPRAHLSDRVKHRFYHKYDYLVLSHGEIYCTGCGRCIDACSAGIDMRDVFRKVKAQAAK